MRPLRRLEEPMLGKFVARRRLVDVDHESTRLIPASRPLIADDAVCPHQVARSTAGLALREFMERVGCLRELASG